MSYKYIEKDGKTIKVWQSVEEDHPERTKPTFASLVGNPDDNEKLSDVLNDKEDVSNKVTSVSENSTDKQYASAKLLYDITQHIVNFSGTITNNIVSLTRCDVDITALQSWITKKWIVSYKLILTNTVTGKREQYEGKLNAINNFAANEVPFIDFCIHTSNTLHKHITISFNTSIGWHIESQVDYQPKLVAGTNITINQETNTISATFTPMAFHADFSALSSSFKKVEIIHIRNNNSDITADDCYISRIDDYSFAVLGGQTTYKLEVKTTDNNGSQHTQWYFDVVRPANTSKLVGTFTGPTYTPELSFSWQ